MGHIANFYHQLPSAKGLERKLLPTISKIVQRNTLLHFYTDMDSSILQTIYLLLENPWEPKLHTIFTSIIHEAFHVDIPRARQAIFCSSGR